MPFIWIFDGDGNLLLDLFGGAAGPLGDDLDVVVGDVGVGFYRQRTEREDAPDEQEQPPMMRTRKRFLRAKSTSEPITASPCSGVRGR